MNVLKIKMIIIVLHFVATFCNAQERLFKLKQSQVSCIYSHAIQQIINNNNFIGFEIPDTLEKESISYSIVLDKSNLLPTNDYFFLLKEKNGAVEYLKNNAKMLKKSQIIILKPFVITNEIALTSKDSNLIQHLQFSRIVKINNLFYFSAQITFKEYYLDNSFVNLREKVYFEIDIKDDATLIFKSIKNNYSYSEPNVKLFDQNGKLNNYKPSNNDPSLMLLNVNCTCNK